MFDFLHKTEKLPRAIRKAIAPRKEFTEKTKATFLAVFDAAHPAPQAARGITAIAKSFIAAGALVAIFAGVTVYADTANVAASNPLYPLKRLGESVQLVVASPQEKAQLQATFAVRRADEIKNLEQRTPSSTIIASLNQDLNTEVSASLNDADSANLQDGNLTNFCARLSDAVASSSVSVRIGMVGQVRIFDRFENRCAGKDNASGTIIMPPTSPSSTAAFPTSTNPHRGSRGFYRIFNPSSTLPIGTGPTIITASTTVGVITTTVRLPFYRLPKVGI